MDVIRRKLVSDAKKYIDFENYNFWYSQVGEDNFTHTLITDNNIIVDLDLVFKNLRSNKENQLSNESYKVRCHIMEKCVNFSSIISKQLEDMYWLGNFIDSYEKTRFYFYDVVVEYIEKSPTNHKRINNMVIFDKHPNFEIIGYNNMRNLLKESRERELINSSKKTNSKFSLNYTDINAVARNGDNYFYFIDEIQSSITTKYTSFFQNYNISGLDFEKYIYYIDDPKIEAEYVLFLQKINYLPIMYAKKRKIKVGVLHENMYRNN